MSLTLKLTRESEDSVRASSQDGVYVTFLPWADCAKWFPPGKTVIFVKARVRHGEVTILNTCKPWKD